jgi:hypothetical protein
LFLPFNSSFCVSQQADLREREHAASKCEAAVFWQQQYLRIMPFTASISVMSKKPFSSSPEGHELTAELIHRHLERHSTNTKGTTGP